MCWTTNKTWLPLSDPISSVPLELTKICTIIMYFLPSTDYICHTMSNPMFAIWPRRSMLILSTPGSQKDYFSGVW